MKWRMPCQEVDQRKFGEIVEKSDCQARKLNREDAMDRNGWRKQIQDDWWLITMIGVSGWMFLLVPAHLFVPDKIQRAVKWCVRPSVCPLIINFQFITVLNFHNTVCMYACWFHLHSCCNIPLYRIWLFYIIHYSIHKFLPYYSSTPPLSFFYIWPIKKLSDEGAGMVICLGRGTDLHMAQLMPLPLTVSCSSKIQIGFTFLVSTG